MAIPEKCPKCGVPGSVLQQGRFQNCTDCGSAWPVRKKKVTKKATNTAKK